MKSVNGLLLLLLFIIILAAATAAIIIIIIIIKFIIINIISIIKSKQLFRNIYQQVLSYICSSYFAPFCLIYVAAKATYIRLLHGKIGILGVFSALPP